MENTVKEERIIEMAFNHQFKNPSISVILTDYVDHRYVLDSLLSVFEQDLLSEHFEIILLTDSKTSPAISALINSIKYDYTILFTDRIPIGKTYIIGAKFARGSIICPLDNDDLWDKERLKIVLETFEKNNRLIFMKHDVKLFSDFNEQFKFFKFLSLGINATWIGELEISSENLKMNPSSYIDALKINPLFNTSSMSFSSSIFSKLPEAFGKVSNFPESFLFFWAALQNGSMSFLNVQLSSYRIRKNSLSKTGFKLSESTYINNLESIKVQFQIIQLLNKDSKSVVLRHFQAYIKYMEMLINYRGSKRITGPVKITLLKVFCDTVYFRRAEYLLIYFLTLMKSLRLLIIKESN